MSQNTSNANAMWGGHYVRGPAEIMAEINRSLDFDKRLYRQDIDGSRAHCRMLVKQAIITPAEGEAILGGLARVLEEIESGTFVFHDELEDIHMNIEARLAELIGETAGKLHTARSRNDQAVTDLRLWVRDAADALDGAIRAVQAALIDRAGEYAETILPGFTHLQSAQPVTLGHHLLAYVEMLGRDRSRLRDARARMNECPLGSGALAGTSFPLDRAHTAELLGFDRPTANSMDAVADRDFAVEFLSACALCAVHLSRLAEEFILWATPQFAFIALSEAFTTGSSIMPQKRNPDAAELVRGKAARVAGSLHTLLMLLKGLPLTYNKDLQEDKEPLFDAFDTLTLCLLATEGMVRDFTANVARMRESAAAGYATATDLADWLVRTLGMPFRQAHHITGRIVRLAEAKGCRLDELSLAEMQGVEPGVTQAVFAVLSVENSVGSRTVLGGTAPERVRAAAEEARRRFL